MNKERIREAVKLDSELRRLTGLSCDNTILQNMIYGHEHTLNDEQKKTICALKEVMKNRVKELEKALEII